MEQKVHGLEQYRVLCAMLALEEFTTEDLAKFSGVKETTVQTIVSRKRELLDRIGTQATGRPGGQFTRYRMNADQASSLRAEISDALGQLPVLEPEAASSTVGLTPSVNLLAAEDALLRLFPQADTDEERQGLLRLAQLSIDGALDDADAIRAASDRKEAQVLDARLRAVQSLRDLATAEINQVNNENLVGDALAVMKKVVDRARSAIADLHRLSEGALAHDIADRVGASRIVSTSVLSGSNLGILKTWDAHRFKEWLLGCVVGGASVPLVFRPTSVFVLEVSRLFDAADTTVRESVFKIGLIKALHEWKLNLHGLDALRALTQMVRLLGAAEGVRRLADLAVIDLTRHSEQREAKKLYASIIRTLRALYFVAPAADALHTLFINDKYVQYAGILFVGACRANPDKCAIYLERLFYIRDYLYGQVDVKWALSSWLRELYPVHLLRGFPALTAASADRLIALFDEISLDVVLSPRVKDVSEALFYQDDAAKYAHTLFRILCLTAGADWPHWVNRLNDLGDQGIEVDFPAAARTVHRVVPIEAMAEKFALVASADRFMRAYFTGVDRGFQLSPKGPSIYAGNPWLNNPDWFFLPTNTVRIAEEDANSWKVETPERSNDIWRCLVDIRRFTIDQLGGARNQLAKLSARTV